MEFRRDESLILSPLVDEEGRRYAELPGGLVDFGDVSRHLMHRQNQYGSRYIDGSVASYPKLGGGLRIEGNPADYHGLGIHPEDIDEFLRRYIAYQAYRLGFVIDDNGNIYEIDEDAMKRLETYLTDVGAFDTPWAQAENSQA